MPISLKLDDVVFDFKASNVTDDALADLILMSGWLAGIEPHSNAVENNSSRCVHFWREPKWNSLVLDAEPNKPSVTVSYFHEHKSRVPLSPTPDDLLLLTPHFIGRGHRIQLAGMIGQAVENMLRTTPMYDYLVHWGHHDSLLAFGVLRKVLRTSVAPKN